MITKTAIDLQKFCGEDETFGSSARYIFTQPFTKNGWTYATDGRICIRIPTGDTNTEPPPQREGESFQRQFPPCDDLFKPVKEPISNPWPTTGMVRAVEVCPQCDGEGVVGCEECGEKRCLYCKGTLRMEQTIGRKVGAHLVGVKYDDLILSLPSPYWIAGAAPNRALPFTFSGGEGQIMPRQWPVEYTIDGAKGGTSR